MQGKPPPTMSPSASVDEFPPIKPSEEISIGTVVIKPSNITSSPKQQKGIEALKKAVKAGVFDEEHNGK